MNEKTRYLKYMGIICIALIVFALGVMFVGYQPFDGKHVGTVVALAVAAVVCFVISRRKQD